MAEKKKGKKRKEDFPGSKEEVEKPAKVEYDIAKWLRSNIPTKKTKFLNHHVEYFTGNKAVDALLGSKWGTSDPPLFVERTDVVNFLNDMLVHKFFHRAKKVPVTEQELKGRSKKKDSDKSEKDEPKKKDEATAESQNEGKESKGESKDKEQLKKRRKIRLDMHNEQVFVDAPDAYVWIYDPIPFYYWIIGAALVLGAIGVCMFPLWPPSVRKGVYYLSVAAVGFLVLIIALTTLRLVVFCIVWALSMSKHHLWLLPNLTEDVGFFASFWPLYQYEYKGDGAKKPEKGKKKKKKDKVSDDEGDAEVEPPLTPAETKGKKKRLVDGKDSQGESDRGEKGDSQNEEAPGGKDSGESESEGSQRSSTGKDFEIVDAQDVDTS